MLEVNGNLDDLEIGIPNFNDFFETVIEVQCKFIHYFGEDIMNSIPLLIDNGTAHTGHTPIITKVWNKGLIIKLHIEDGRQRGKIIHQLAHEFTHYVFYSLVGLDKPRADFDEESYCSAASLILIKEFLQPEELKGWENLTANLHILQYRKGLDVARKVNYNMNELKTLIFEKAKEMKKLKRLLEHP